MVRWLKSEASGPLLVCSILTECLIFLSLNQGYLITP